MLQYINSFDLGVLLFIREHFRCGFLDIVMPLISALGNFGMVWLAAGAALVVSPKHRRLGVLLIVALAAAWLVSDCGIKTLVARTRPCNTGILVDMLINAPKSYSFPSGHTMSSFLCAGILTYADRRFGIPAFVLAVLIAFSRMYLFVHYPTDVLAGMVLGLLFAAVSIAVYRRITGERAVPKN